MSLRKNLDFYLYDWIDAEALTDRPRFADHSRETFGSVFDTCDRIARELFAPANRKADIEEPTFNGEYVTLPATTTAAVRAQVGCGILAAAQDYDIGGMQLPCTIQMACSAIFGRASVPLAGYAGLTRANATLLTVHGTELQKRVFAANEFTGRWLGTMCLSEPQAGSSLSDINTRATEDGGEFESDPLGPRYRLRGNKMWISGGEHEITENIIHLVLAKIPEPDGKIAPGVKGISLFIVPKKLVDIEGRLTGERNDVALAGLNHKLGYRGTTNTLLNFGEGRYPVRDAAGAIGYRVGNAGDGLRCMFHMMNEARINVGLGATMLGYAGYEASLDYAFQRPQGRSVGPEGKDPTSPQLRIIEHSDVKRMLLAQKAYVEGALALAIYCARLVDEQRTGERDAAKEAISLLEVLTPIMKSWPSEFCLEANSLAIQVHGGYGYTRDFPVEQYWRDNRLNMIHEGTHGVQGKDLLGRKVRMNDGAAFKILTSRIRETAERARVNPSLASYASQLEAALTDLATASESAWKTSDAEEALANATPYLQGFGHIVLAWIWLDVAITSSRILESPPMDGSPTDEDFHSGKLAAMRFFFVYELPKVDAWLTVVAARDATCRLAHEAWF